MLKTHKKHREIQRFLHVFIVNSIFSTSQGYNKLYPNLYINNKNPETTLLLFRSPYYTKRHSYI